MLAKDIMVREVIKVGEDATVGEVIHLLAENKIGGLPVVNDRNEVLGIITDGDLMKHIRTHRPMVVDVLTDIFVFADMTQLEDKARELIDVPVRNIMTRRVATAGEDTELGMVAALMSDRKIKKVPVVRDNVLVGLISRGDIVRALSQRFKEKH
ncbi:MAG: CBS domain-containing protein [Clostridia bacterium]|nr:MAG: CBS domain-containing protein [Clostridia bacterium]